MLPTQNAMKTVCQPALPEHAGIAPAGWS